jgi:uncharacterized integral membrane protein (TIGR00697 family)
MNNKRKLTNVSALYMVLVTVYVACLLISNVTAVKTFSLGPFSLPAAVLLFPVVYIVNDLLAEVYGFRKARKAIYLGFILNLFMVLYFALAIALPAGPFFGAQDAFATILGSTPRMLIASLAAYFVGSTLNAKVMVSMRNAANGRGGFALFLRCITSTLSGELCDSLIFITIAFIGAMPFTQILVMVATQAAFKTLYEMVVFPVTNIVIKKVRGIEDGYLIGYSEGSF